MRDGVGRIQHVLLIGGTSDIGRAIVASLRPSEGTVLAGRDPDALRTAASGLASAGLPNVTTCPFVAGDGRANEESLTQALQGRDVDVVIVAVGELGDQRLIEAEPSEGSRLATSTYVGGLEGSLIGSRLLASQGHGTLVVLSSVAALRPRRSNFVYGSAKAGLDFLARGLRDALRGTGVDVVLVRPGFVHSRMTEGLPAAPLAITPSAVGAQVARILARRAGGRRAAGSVVYAPPALRYVMAVLRALPGPVFRRLPL